ncbi:hypothetical protein [Streptomyces sp. NPDC059928]|uniref:hypothetical protein n=1 Tax=unclassified Streptomyces TaxID=2593676 RepID=UPI003662AEE2
MTELREFYVTALRATVAEAGNEEGLDDSRTQWTMPVATEIAVVAVPTSPGGVYALLPLGDDLAPPLPAISTRPSTPRATARDTTGTIRLNTMLLHAAALRDSAEPDAARLAVDLVSWQAGWAGGWPRRTQGRGLLVAEVIGDLISLVSRLCTSHPHRSAASHSLRARSTSIATGCSDAAVGVHPTTADLSTASCPIVSLTWRLSLDQQIRR